MSRLVDVGRLSLALILTVIGVLPNGAAGQVSENRDPIATTPTYPAAADALRRECIAATGLFNNSSAGALQKLLRRPATLRELLVNLKTASDEELAIDPNFVDQHTLEIFFNADQVSWIVQDNTLQPKDLHIVGASVRLSWTNGIQTIVRSQCRQVAPPGAGRKATNVSVRGEVEMMLTHAAPLTLREVREVFGMERENTTDSRYGFDSGEAPPKYKGWANYPNELASVREGMKLGIRFVFAFDGKRRASPQAPAVDEEDEVRWIELEAAHSEVIGGDHK